MSCSTTYQALQGVFQSWVHLHAREMRGGREAELVKVKRKLPKHGGGKTSIWKMKKAQLVEEAVKVLGWKRTTAEAQANAQLRRFLKEAGAAAKPEQRCGEERLKTNAKDFPKQAAAARREGYRLYPPHLL